MSRQRAWSAFRSLNWAVSGAATAAVVLGVRRGRPALPGVVAAAMLVNVGVPHVPAAVRARGYAPGVVTAVTLVLTASGRYLWECHRRGLRPTPACAGACWPGSGWLSSGCRWGW